MVRKSNLEIKESQIPGAGKGLYTKVNIKKDTVIGYFEGEIISYEEGEKRLESDGYFITIDENTVFDCYPFHSEVKYANDAEGLNTNPKFKNNSKLYRDFDGKFYLYSEKYIPKGSEIFAEYGEDYWESVLNNMLNDTN